jgi:hypothetical protein
MNHINIFQFRIGPKDEHVKSEALNMSLLFHVMIVFNLYNSFHKIIFNSK